MMDDEQRLGPEDLAEDRVIEAIWDELDTEPSPAQRADERYMAVRERLGAVRDAARSLRAADTPDTGTADRLTAGIMALARSEARRSRLLVLRRDADLTIEASETALARTVRDAVDALPDVTCRRVRVAVSDDQQPTGLTIRVIVAHHVHIPDLVEQIRGAAHDALELEVGITVGRCDVVVEDVFDA